MHLTQNLEKEFIYSITHWFQPIYNLKNNSVIGYEALLRDASDLQLSPVNILKNAEQKGCRNILDLTSIKNALDIYKGESHYLFLNIFPSTLLKGNFLSWWDIHVPRKIPVVLELLESEPISDWEKLKAIINELKRRGIKIAIDDMGAGYSTIRQWVELDPEFVKLDKYFSENLSVNTRKQKIIKSYADLFSDTSKLIIEGIEKKEDLETIYHLGVQYAQGYFLGRPSPRKKDNDNKKHVDKILKI
ncbi:EAL domain-containing protein [Sedimentibacter sp.]|uniref:EAL domain-containing protein n=1 Tax=Sedimentibacter sp. TaxID=1960295 RepID=UPI0028A79441|nr:EAL domain-containing protein [Sedimentibacter sp.]